MRRHTTHKQLNTAGLEADVMRFMAIIAFCLIAIMALVKDVEPQLGVEPQPDVKSQSEVTTEAIEDSSQEPEPSLELVTVVKAQKPLKPEAKTSTQAVKIGSTRERTSILSAPDISIPMRSQVIANHDNTVQPASVNVAAEEQLEEREEALTFRFDSDSTFIHLIGSKKLKLFASTHGAYLEMDDRFNVTSSSPSGELFEIMKQSIPRTITTIFERESGFHKVDSSLIYLVALSKRTRNDLDHFLGASNSRHKKNLNSGVLVIHQDGHISHET
jgi:hypothetical protein